MRYSMDGRKRVLDFIQQGGRKAEASRRFQVSRTAIYQWLAAPDPLTYEKPGPENRDFLTLKPSESMLPTSRIRHLRSERKSSVFLKKASTTPSASVASPEKSLGSKERCPEKRATYQATLAKAIREEKREPVSIDECGFTAEILRIYGYAPEANA